MRTLLAIAALLFSTLAQPAQVTFAWDAVTGATGYRVWCGPSTRNYGTTPLIGVTSLTATATLTTGTYFCAATAFNATQQSVHSNEITFTIAAPPLAPPPNFRFTITLADGREVGGDLVWSEEEQAYVAVVQ